MQDKKKWGYFDAVFLGLVFALAFCPYSGVLYFGMLVPLTVTSASGLYLPVIFAVATGIPVIIIAWVLAYTVSGIGNVYNKLKSFELWFRTDNCGFVYCHRNILYNKGLPIIFYRIK